MIKYKKAEIAILTHWVKISHSEWEWNGWLLLLLVWSVRSFYSRGLAKGAHEREVRKAQENCFSFPAQWELLRRRPSTVVHSHSKPTHPQNAESGEKRAFSIESSQARRALCEHEKGKFPDRVDQRGKEIFEWKIYIREKRECWRMSRSDVMLRV